MNTPILSPSETLAAFLLWLLAIPVIIGFCLKAPKLVALGFIFVLFMFSSSTWGQLQVENTIYSRGAGLFYYSLLNLILFVVGVGLLIRKLANPHSPYAVAPLSKYLLAFLFLLFGHIVLGLMSGEDILLILGNNGIINILNMMIFMYLMASAFTSDRDKRNLLLTFLVLAGIRAVFGIVRYVWFGGDDANPYRNFEQLDIKILFFDISDNYVASLAAFCAAWLLTTPGIRIGLLKRIGLYLYLALEVAAVALSFRRSSLIGMALMFSLLIFRLPPRRRIQFMLLAFAIVSITAMLFFQERGKFNTSGNVLDSLIYDISSQSGGIKENRFYELYAAAQSLSGNWLFGLGSWGTFTGDQELLSYHFGKFDFVHSGFGHIILKTGLVGLLLFCSLLFAYASYYFRHRKMLTGNARLLSDAGFAGFLFWMPTLLIGTPIIEFRSMLLIGLTLALPFIAVGMESYQLQKFQSLGRVRYAAA